MPPRGRPLAKHFSESVATLDSNGVMEGKAVGISTVTAAYEGVTTSGTANVVTGLVGIQIFPPNTDVAVDLDRAFRLVGLYGDHTTRDLTASATWSVHDPRVAAVSGNVATGVAPGSTRITAAYAGRNATTNITVSGRKLTALTIDGGPTSLAQRTTGSLTATATFDDATRLDVTRLAAWKSSDAAVATVDSAGTVSPLAEGTATISATFSQGIITVPDAVQEITVKPDSVVLTSIAVSPTSATIPLDTAAEFAATATFSDGTTRDVTGDVVWSTKNVTGDTKVHATLSDGTVATTSRPGTTIVSGTTTVVATFALAGGVSKTGEANLTVTDGALTSVSIAPPGLTIAVGGKADFVATGHYDDPADFTFDLTRRVTWFANDGTPLNDVVLGIDPVSGLATGLAPDSATVEAWLLGEKKGEVAVTVR
jgi:trimeric autotransporter adhesin